MSFDLIKRLNEDKAKVFTLTKGTVLDTTDSFCMFALDDSGSMGHLYRDGYVQRLTERLLPIAMAFDDNGEMEVYQFANGVSKAKAPATSANIAGYVGRDIRHMGGGTAYAPALRQILNDYLEMSGQKAGAGASTLLGKVGSFFGGGKAQTTVNQNDKILPGFCIFISDGENFDTEDTRRVLIEASNYGLFFATVGLGSGRFGSLNDMDTMTGRKRDNASFFSVTPQQLETMSAEQFLGGLLKEYPAFVAKAKADGIIA